MTMAIEPKSKADEDKLSSALTRLMEEDHTLQVQRASEMKQTVISGMGESHLEIVADRLKRKFGVEVTLSVPRVPYRETVRAHARVQGKYKRQTGGRGQYGDCWIELDPKPRNGGYEFVDKIFGGSIPRNFIPAVEKGVKEAMGEGIVAGYHVIDVRVTLVDGSYHDVDSSDMAFKIAGSMAFKKAMQEARPVLLEPVMSVAVRVPEDQMGDIIGDLNSKRARIQGMEPGGRQQEAVAEGLEGRQPGRVGELHQDRKGAERSSRGEHHERAPSTSKPHQSTVPGGCDRRVLGGRSPAPGPGAPAQTGFGATPLARRRRPPAQVL